MQKASHCVILAAGRNTRLDKGIPKSLTPLNGETIIQRHIRIFSKIGIKSFCVIGGYQFDKLKEYLPQLASKHNVTIDLYLNDDLEKENGYSVFCASQWARENKINEFLLSMGDHIFNEGLVKQFVDSIHPSGQYLDLAVDIPGPTNSHIDLEDVTKVEVDPNGNIQKIGKELTKYNRFDTGLFRMRSEVFDQLTENFKKNRFSISNLVSALSEKKKAKATTLSGFTWNDIDNQLDLESTLELIEEGRL